MDSVPKGMLPFAGSLATATCRHVADHISHRRNAFVKALLVVAVSLTVALIGGRDASAENCLDRLNSRSYSCEIKNSLGGGGSFSVSFNDGALTIAGDQYTCSCGATGTFKNPNFNASKT